jgi:hypothetical protein
MKRLLTASAILTATMMVPVHAQQWQMETVNGQQFGVLLPQNYNSGTQYPVVIYSSPLDTGSDPSAQLSKLSPWLATLESSYPSIVVAPFSSPQPGTDATAGNPNSMTAIQQASAQSATSPTVAATGGFHTANGQIIGPDGKPFIAKGINVFQYQTGGLPGPILADFPGINMIRLAVQAYDSPDALSAFVDQMTARHIVVEIEDHSPPFGSNNVLSNSALSNALAWFNSVAAAFKDNPYVWFGTMNEPDNAGDEAQVTLQEAAVYNEIRSVGNSNPIMLEEIAGYTVSKNGDSLVASSYATMHNVIWDTHVYGWESNFSTDPGTITAALNAQVSAIQAIKSGDGTMPVIIGEYGISSTGFGNPDPNGTQLVSAVDASGISSLAWAWSAGTDSMVDENGLNTFGNQVAAYIRSNTTPVALAVGSTSSPASTPTAFVAANSSAAAAYTIWNQPSTPSQAAGAPPSTSAMIQAAIDQATKATPVTAATATQAAQTLAASLPSPLPPTPLQELAMGDALIRQAEAAVTTNAPDATSDALMQQAVVAVQAAIAAPASSR